MLSEIQYSKQKEAGPGMSVGLQVILPSDSDQLNK